MHSPEEFQRLRNHQVNGMGGLPLDPAAVSVSISSCPVPYRSDVLSSDASYRISTRKAHVKYLDRGDRGLAHGTDTYGTGMTVTPQICAASAVDFREMWFGADDRAQALRARVMPLFAEGPLRISDFIGAEPDVPGDAAARGGSSPKIRVTN